MNKFKITVETKSRSKVVIEDEFNVGSEQELKEALQEAYNSITIMFKDYFFKCDNVNYIQVQEVK